MTKKYDLSDIIMAFVLGGLMGFMFAPRGAHAAQFTLSGTYPDNDNGGTCTAPVLIPQTTGTKQINLRVMSGATVVLADSISGAAATPFAITRSLPAGIYSFRVWPSDSGGAGCDTVFTKQLKGPPWKKPISVQ